MRILFGSDSRSTDTDERLQEYLRDRLLGVNTIDLGVIEVVNPPRIVTLTKSVQRPYIKSPKTQRPAWYKSLAFWGGVSVIAPNATEIPALIEDAKNIVEQRTLHPVQVETRQGTITIPYQRDEERVITETVERKQTLSSTSINQTGQVAPDQSVIDSILNELDTVIAQGGIINHIEIIGSASDEWGALSNSAGVADKGNSDTALARAETFARTLIEQANERGFSIGDISISQSESVLDDVDINTLEQLVAQFGSGSVDELWTQYKSDPDSIPDAVKDFFDVRFGSKRGSIINAHVTTFEQQDKTILVSVPDTREETIDIESRTPLLNPKEFTLFPLFLPPIGLKEKLKTKTIKQDDITKIPLTDEAILKLYPEAKLASGALDQDSWRWTRKYQYLMRDDRIHYVHKFDYKDAKGKNQTLRVAFVDHTPSPHVLEAVEQMLIEAASIDDGKIGDRLSLIAIFPKDDALSSDPQRVGLGIDSKHGPGVGGLAIPALGLVEISMDIHSTPADLDAHFGLKHVFRHEVSGHFTDLTSSKPRLQSVKGIHNGFYLKTPWSLRMMDAYIEATAKLASHPSPQWHVTTAVDGTQPGIGHSPDGGLFQRDMNQSAVDPLTDVVSVEQAHGITEYGLSHPLELWAETVAHGFGDIPLDPMHTPFGASLPQSTMDRIGGVRPARELMEFVHSELGTMVDRDGVMYPRAQKVVSSSTTTTGTIDVDAEFAEIVADAKSRNLPADKDLINIVTSVRTVGGEPPSRSPKQSNIPASRAISPATKALPWVDKGLSL